MKILAASINGSLVDSKSVACYLDKSQHSFNGVYEAVQTYYGKPFRFAQHLQRLEHSILSAGQSIPYPKDALIQWTMELIGKNPALSQFILIFAEINRYVIITLPLEYDFIAKSKGYRVSTVSVERPSPLVKSILARAVSAKALSQARKLGFDEIILVDHEGFCREGAYSNLFWVRNTRLFTTTHRALMGITQQAVIEIWDGNEDVQVRRISSEQLSNTDEVFLTSSRIEITPVISIDDKPIGNGRPGTVTRRVQNLFHQLIELECH